MPVNLYIPRRFHHVELMQAYTELIEFHTRDATIQFNCDVYRGLHSENEAGRSIE